MSSGKYLPFGDQPTKARISGIEKSKPISESFVVKIRGDELTSTPLFPDPYSLPIWGAIPYKGL